MPRESRAEPTTRDTGSYVDATAAFSKANFQRVRYFGGWVFTGFTSISAEKGWQIGWEASLKPQVVDGYGTVDMTVESLIANAKCVPIGPSRTQLKTRFLEEAAMGSLGSTTGFVNDLTITGDNSGPVIVLKSAFIKELGETYDVQELRNGETTWETTRGFVSGAGSAIATIT